MINDTMTKEQRLHPKKTKQVNWLNWSIGLNIALLIFIVVLMYLGNQNMELLMKCLIK